MNTTILVVEDDQDLRDILTDILSDFGYTVYTTNSGAKSLKLVEKIRPQLVILDLGLPDIDGETVCARIKESFPEISVIILTGKSETQSLVGSFEKGADDYIQKPFANEELIARIKARLKEQRRHEPELTIADLTINTDTLEVYRQNQKIDLTQTEFQLLHYLMVNANRVLSREQILSHVWSQDPDIETRVVDVYIGYLRKKIDRDQEPKLIHSKRGFGYILKFEEL